MFGLLCCGCYSAVVDLQIAVDIQSLLARRYQMLLLCQFLWVQTLLGLQRARLTNITDDCRVTHTTLHGLLAQGEGTLRYDSNARSCTIRA